MMEQMTLDELKTGMHVVTRDGIEYVVLKDTVYNKDILIAVHEDYYADCWGELKDYNNDMTHKNTRKYDIVKVYAPMFEYTTINCKFDCNEGISDMIYAEEEPITRAEAEKLLGRRIID